MNPVAALFTAGILVILVIIIFLSFRFSKVIGGKLRRTLALVPLATAVFALATSLELLRHLGVIEIQGAYPLLECIWILMVIGALYRIQQLFAHLVREESLTKAGD